MDEELHRAVGRLEGKVDALLQQGIERNTRLAALEIQVAEIKNTQFYGKGAVAGWGAAGGVGMWLIGFLWDKVSS